MPWVATDNCSIELQGTGMQTELHTTDDQREPQYDQDNERYTLCYDAESSATLTTTIVHALALVADVDVSEGEFSLYDSIDPDALERIFGSKADGSRREGGHVAFTALEQEVYVYANGDIHIYPPAHALPPTTSR